MRLSNVKMLLCWPSRMHIYGFIENHTFLEQFVSMGVPAQFSNLGVPAHFWCISLVHVFLYNFLDYTVGYIGSLYAWLRYGTNRWGMNPRHRAKADR